MGPSRLRHEKLGPSVLWCVSDGFREFNSSHFTCAIPHNALVRAGYDSHIIHISNWLDDTPLLRLAAARADIIVIQRVLLTETLEHVKKWRKMGKKVLVSFDDAYHLIGPENAAYKFWGQGLVDVETNGGKYTKRLHDHPVSQFKKMLRHVSAGVCPSRVLAEDWKPFGKMQYLPNYVESSRYEGKRRKRFSQFNIGWGGSLSHLTSFSGSGVEQAILSFLRENDNTAFQLVGDRRLIKQLGVPKEQLIFRDYVMFFDWPDVVGSFDIGLAPLAEPYDQRRSRLKVMEYIALGMPFVATKSAVYEDFFDCRSGIFIDQGAPTVCDKPNPEAWHKAITEIHRRYQDYSAIAIEEKERYYAVYDSLRNVDTIVKALSLSTKKESK